MTTIHQTTDRLIGEHLDELLALGWQIDHRLYPVSTGSDEGRHQPTMPFVRLIAAVRLLYQQHVVDGKGRCRTCTRRVRSRRTRRCTVHAALSFYLTQHDDLVLPELPSAPITQPRLPTSDAELTEELLTIR